jgi:hypothetical protein
MKKVLLSTLLIVLLFSLNNSYAKSKDSDMDNLMVSGGQGSLMVEVPDKSKLTVTIKDSEGKLILSEMISSENGKLQLLGLSNGYYEVEIKNKKASKIFRVEVL